MTTLSRVCFCEQCYKGYKPQKGQLFLVHGTHGFHVRSAIRNGTRGYSPHVIRLVKTIGENVVYEKRCGIHFCGVILEYKETKNDFVFDYLGEWQRGIISIQEWNAWVQYKNDPQYQI